MQRARSVFNSRARCRVGAVMAMGLLCAGPAAGQKPDPGAVSPGAVNDVIEVVSTGGAPARGPETAPVTLVVFTDLDSSACEGLAVVLHALGEMYPERVRMVFKHQPSTRDNRSQSHEAVQAAAAQGRFWDMYEMLLANQGRRSRADLIAMAAQIELDVAQFTAELDGGAHRAVVAADGDEAVRLKIEATPTMFLNGRRLAGSRTLTELRRFVDAIAPAVARIPGA